MRPLLKATVSAAAGLVVVITFALAIPLLGGPRTYADLYLLVFVEPVRGDALDARAGAVQRCHDAKREVTNELIAGRLSLAEAADRFERLDAELDGPRAPDRPASLRAVLRWVESELPSTADRREVLARLERESNRLEAATRG